MDEPTAALTESDVTRLFDIVRRLKRRGVGIVYISHRLDEIFAHRRSRDGAARRRLCRRAARSPTRTPRELVQMMVGRRIDNLFPKIARADRRAGARSARSRAPAADQERQPHGAAPAKSSASPASSAPAAASSRRRCSASRRPSRARSGSMAKASRIDSPETRARKGHRLCAGRSRHAGPGPADERPAQLLARRARPSRPAPDSSTAPPSVAWREQGVAAVQRQDELGRRDRRPAVRRQPAEDRAGQVARQQSQAPHPRRADARHRRRRQGRDPSADERARRARASRS